MRLFWLFILALLISAIVLREARVRSPQTAAPSAERITIDRAFDPVPARPKAPDPQIETIAQQTDDADDAPAPETEQATGSADQIADSSSAEQAQEQEAVNETDTTQSLVTSNNPESSDQLGAIEERTQASETAQQSPPETSGEIVIDLSKLNKPKPDHTVNADGSITLTDGTVIRGSGAADDPYTLSWALLRSVERTYQPRAGKDEFPEWIKKLDGQTVRIEGNTLLPVMSDSARELLVMQNPWDGCCIGIPPTPFDAIEVELVHDVDFGYETVGYGLVTGTFLVDPYVVDGWVLGVYLLKDASYKSDAGTPLSDL
jgi:hypothetical protein